MSPDSRMRPSSATETHPEESIATDIPSVSDLAAVCDAHVIAVVTENPPDLDGEAKRARRIYLSLHSAEKAARRAELRGQRASLVLCKITPVQGDLQSTGWSA